MKRSITAIVGLVGLFIAGVMMGPAESCAAFVYSIEFDFVVDPLLPSGGFQATITTTPEPGSFALMAIGAVAVLSSYGWRRLRIRGRETV